MKAIIDLPEEKVRVLLHFFNKICWDDVRRQTSNDDEAYEVLSLLENISNQISANKQEKCNV